jgi:hypothetical protein
MNKYAKPRIRKTEHGWQVYLPVVGPWMCHTRWADAMTCVARYWERVA